MGGVSGTGGVLGRATPPSVSSPKCFKEKTLTIYFSIFVSVFYICT